MKTLENTCGNKLSSPGHLSDSKEELCFNDSKMTRKSDSSIEVSVVVISMKDEKGVMFAECETLQVEFCQSRVHT